VGRSVATLCHDPQVYAYLKSSLLTENLTVPGLSADPAVTSLNDPAFSTSPRSGSLGFQEAAGAWPFLLNAEMFAGHGVRSGMYCKRGGDTKRKEKKKGKTKKKKKKKQNHFPCLSYALILVIIVTTSDPHSAGELSPWPLYSAARRP